MQFKSLHYFAKGTSAGSKAHGTVFFHTDKGEIEMKLTPRAVEEIAEVLRRDLSDHVYKLITAATDAEGETDAVKS